MTLLARILKSRFLRFALVGGTGFFVNEAALYCVLRLARLDKYSAWLAAFLVAVTFTWWGNRTLTFRDRAAQKGLFAEWGAFVIANSLGAIANFAVYFTLVTFAGSPLNNPLVAVAAGTLIGLVFNYTTSQRFVFRNSAKAR